MDENKEIKFLRFKKGFITESEKHKKGQLYITEAEGIWSSEDRKENKWKKQEERQTERRKKI